MNENIDLTKILKNCPKDTKFYSTVLGEIKFIEIIYDAVYPIIVSSCNDGKTEAFTADGKLILEYDGECALFPSKDQRDWNKFSAPWYKKLIESKFNVGQYITDWYVVGQITSIEDEYHCYKILDFMGGVSTTIPFTLQDNYHLWTIKDAKDGDVIQFGIVTAIFKKYIGEEKCVCYCSFCKDGGFEIPIENGENNVYGCYNATPTTKEQRDIFMKAMNAAGYKWDTEKKELRKLVEPKFKVGDRITHRVCTYMGVFEPNAVILEITEDKYILNDGFIYIIDQDSWELVPDKKQKFDPKTLKPFDRVLVRDYNDDKWVCSIFSHIESEDSFHYECILELTCRYCIPYNDDTKHLVGTTEEAPEFYRYW